MSGETEDEVSGWTVDTIAYHLQRQLDDLQILHDSQMSNLRALLDERFETQTAAVGSAITDRKEAVDKALAAADKALDVRSADLSREFHEHIQQVKHENALALDNAEKREAAAFQASKEAIHAALASSKEAIGKSETANEKRFEGVNEFRGQLSDQATTFMPREVAEATFKELRGKIETLQTRQDESKGKGAGYASLYGWALGAVALLISVIVAANALVGR